MVDVQFIVCNELLFDVFIVVVCVIAVVDNAEHTAFIIHASYSVNLQ